MAEKVVKSKKNITIGVCMFFVAVAVLAGGVSNLQKNEEQKQAQVVSEKHDERKYILKLHNGKLAVFNEGENIPAQITDISERTLRKFDYEQLSEGVVVVGDVELAMRLEDYGS